MSDIYYVNTDLSGTSLEDGWEMWCRNEGQIESFWRYTARGAIPVTGGKRE